MLMFVLFLLMPLVLVVVRPVLAPMAVRMPLSTVGVVMRVLVLMLVPVVVNVLVRVRMLPLARMRVRMLMGVGVLVLVVMGMLVVALHDDLLGVSGSPLLAPI